MMVTTNGTYYQEDNDSNSIAPMRLILKLIFIDKVIVNNKNNALNNKS